MVQVKGNQPTLFREAQRAIVEGAPLDHFEVHEKGHGRHSHWYVAVFDAADSPKAGEWEGLRRFVHVHKHTVKDGAESHSDRLYITDLFETSARFYQEGIRGHWTIENSLHWVKDVVHNEDKNRVAKGNGPLNRAVFSSVAINIHRKEGGRSVTDNQIKFGANVKELFDFIRT